jgi:hypothetical protein
VNALYCCYIAVVRLIAIVMDSLCFPIVLFVFVFLLSMISLSCTIIPEGCPHSLVIAIYGTLFTSLLYWYSTMSLLHFGHLGLVRHLGSCGVTHFVVEDLAWASLCFLLLMFLGIGTGLPVPNPQLRNKPKIMENG